MDPLVGGLISGGLSAGMGILQGITGNQAQKQDYLNQKVFQEQQAIFSKWQSGLNAKIADQNSAYKYWGDVVNYNQQLAYTNSLRNVEVMKAIRQAETVRDTRAAAGASYVQDSEALSQQLSEASMQEAVASQQYKWRALQGQASVRAMEAEGNSVDRLVNDYARQQGDYETLMAIGKGLRERQYNRSQTARATQYLSQWQSEQYYEQSKIFDPIPPFAPLPTLVQPPGPSMTGGSPSSAAAALNIGSGILGGVTSGLNMYQGLKAMQIPSSSRGAGNSGGG
jgi:hypothetical protein